MDLPDPTVIYRVSLPEGSKREPFIRDCQERSEEWFRRCGCRPDCWKFATPVAARLRAVILLVLSSKSVKTLRLAALFACSAAAFGAGDGPLLDTMTQELQRNFQTLKKKAEPAPYFLSYEITDHDTHEVSATLGVLNSTGNGTTAISMSPSASATRSSTTSGACAASASSSPAALQSRSTTCRKPAPPGLWLETDRVYRASAERLVRIKTNQQVKAADRDTLQRFLFRRKLRPLRSARHRQIRSEALDRQRARLSKRFRQVSRSSLFRRTGFLPVRHSLFRQHRRHRKCSTAAISRASSSPPAPRPRTAWMFPTSNRFEAADPKDLPSGDVIKAAVKKVGENVEALHNRAQSPSRSSAPPFSPAALRASSSTRSSDTASRAIARRTNPKARPSPKASAKRSCPTSSRSLSIRPSKRIGGVDLNGWYEYDDEGSRGRPVKAVENGVLPTS